jgi:hypothetical protein
VAERVAPGAGAPCLAYLGRDLLAEPEYYMYFPFRGQPLLREYAERRAATARELEAALRENLRRGERDFWQRCPAAYHALLRRERGQFSPELLAAGDEGRGSGAVVAARPGIPGLELLADGRTEDLRTEEVLRALLVAVVGGKAAEQAAAARWLDRYLGRFEVAKRLAAVTTRDLKPASVDRAPLASYALLSAALVLGYGGTGRLKALNGVLKLNDVLCSRQGDLRGAESQLLAVLALRKELEAVRAIAAREQVPL